MSAVHKSEFTKETKKAGIMHKNLWRRAALMALALFALMQLVPYGRNHANPPTEMEPP